MIAEAEDDECKGLDVLEECVCVCGPIGCCTNAIALECEEWDW